MNRASYRTDLSLKDVAYAVVLADTLNFRVAAERCYISQPALSKQIQQLETRLGVRLFERDKKRVLLTPAGDVFLEHARRLLDDADALVSALQSEELFFERPLRLGVIPSICPYLLPSLIVALREAYPQLQIQIEESVTADLTQKLRNGQLDAIIAARTFPETGFMTLPLYFEPFRLASWPGHEKKSTRVSKVTPSEINPEGLLLLEDGHCLKDQTLDLCALSSHDQRLNLRASSMNTLLQMTALGMGQAVLPQLVVDAHSDLLSGLLIQPFSDAKIGRDVALFCREKSPFRPQFQALVSFFRQQIETALPTVHLN